MNCNKCLGVTLVLVIAVFIVAGILGANQNLYTDSELLEDCNNYDWTMMFAKESASSTWKICPEKIEFEITATTRIFFLCTSAFEMVQGSNEYSISRHSSDESTALMHWDSFSGCDDLNRGTKVTGWIDEFPSSFDILSPFRIYYDEGFIDVTGSTVPTTSTIVSSTTTTPSSGPCPASTIYGTNSAETQLLRSLRDNVLSTTSQGRELIKLYYQWSPVIVRAMEHDEDFKEEVKKMTDGVLVLVTEEK